MRIRRRLSGRQVHSLAELGFDPRDVSDRLALRISTRPECICPLGIGEPGHAGAGPSHLCRGHGGEDVAINAAVVKFNAVSFDAPNESLLLESVQIISRPLAESSQPEPLQVTRVGSLAQRGSDITYDIPA